MDITLAIADELAVAPSCVAAAVKLLDEGATVPFVARYRKEVTGGLDDTQLRTLETRLTYLRELEARRDSVIASIEEQGKMTPSLAEAIRQADSKSRLEDLYLPYKPKRTTKGQVAIEAGLEPLADLLLTDPDTDPESAAAAFLNVEKQVPTTKEALDGARYILMERFAVDPVLIDRLRELLWEEGQLRAELVPEQEAGAEKFSDYFDHREPINKTPSHRALAMLRGRRLGVLSLALVLDDEPAPASGSQLSRCEHVIAGHFQLNLQNNRSAQWLTGVVRWTWRVKLYQHIETDLFARLRERAEQEAIDVFAANLKDLLLAAPAGPRPTIGLDPGLRTGVKVAVIDATGQVLDHTAIYPHAPQRKVADAEHRLLQLIKQYGVELIAIGNGTASRETDRFVSALLSQHPELRVTQVMVNEAGASIYSASEYASRELPELDVTIRGAVSIARRLQDPLAELVKIEPKSIGVGQYQHDVSQVALSRSLDAVVEDCVNAVGVDVNTASPALLAYVSGLTAATAGQLVQYRNTHGLISSRQELLQVPRIGEKTFELAAGFLRVMDGDNPLDRSAVHPESYLVVDRIAEKSGCTLQQLMGDAALLRSLDPSDFVDERTGLPTIRDILSELEKPGRDPRPEFRTASFKEGVETLTDLRPDMVLEGVVTNVANFGAFVDIGVHQDGLVHISCLSETFVKDPRAVVKAGDIVRVKVLEVDAKRQRIALTMRLGDKAGKSDSVNEARRPRAASAPDQRRTREANARRQPQRPKSALAAAFDAARQKT